MINNKDEAEKLAGFKEALLTVARIQKLVDDNKNKLPEKGGLEFEVLNKQFGVDSFNIHSKNNKLLTNLELQVTKLAKFIECSTVSHMTFSEEDKGGLTYRMMEYLENDVGLDIGGIASSVNLGQTNNGTPELSVGEPASTLIFGRLITLGLKNKDGESLNDRLLGKYEHKSEYAWYKYSGKVQFGIEKLPKIKKIQIEEAFIEKDTNPEKLAKLKLDYAVLEQTPNWEKNVISCEVQELMDSWKNRISKSQKDEIQKVF